MPIVRRLFITDKNGKEIEIKTKEDLDKIINQMTPEEYKKWKDNYRFAPIKNNTKNPYYTGTISDLL